MSRAAHRNRRARRGAHMVEFALLLPIYLLIVTTIVDFGWMAYTSATLYGAAHRGCRDASLIDPGSGEQNISSVTSAAIAQMEAHFEAQGKSCDDDCTVTATPFGFRPGRSIRCEIGVHYEPIIGYVVQETDLSATAVVRLEYQRGGAP